MPAYEAGRPAQAEGVRLVAAPRVSADRRRVISPYCNNSRWRGNLPESNSPREEEDELSRTASYTVETPPGENPPAGNLVAPSSYEEDEEAFEEDPNSELELELAKREDWLLDRAQDIYTNSTNYLDSNITTTWETNLAHFNNQHASTSRFRRSNSNAHPCSDQKQERT